RRDAARRVRARHPAGVASRADHRRPARRQPGDPRRRRRRDVRVAGRHRQPDHAPRIGVPCRSPARLRAARLGVRAHDDQRRAAARRAIRSMRTRPIVLGALSFAVMLAAWEIVARAGWISPFFISQPTQIAAALAHTARSGELARSVGISLLEFAAGFGLAVVVGLVVGVLAGWYPTVEYAIDPFVWFVYSAPLIAFYPLFVLWLGLGPGTVIAISFLLSVTPIAVNTMTGVRQTSPPLVVAARSFGARPGDLLWKVVLPSSVPMIAAGLRLGVGRALTGVVIAELFVPSGGLGSSIAYNAGLLRTTDMLAALMVIVALGVVCTQ